MNCMLDEHFVMDKIIQLSIKECAADEDRWDENYITLELLKSLKKYFRSSGNKLFTENRSILLNAYKNKGKIENKYGDITFIIRRFINRNNYVDGLGFCEAKKEYESYKLESLSTEQLVRMNNEVPNHKLLLHLRQYNQSFEPKHRRMGIWPHWFSHSPYLACTIPSINAVKLKSKQARDYLPDSIPLSYQIMGKYLEGFDLTYDANLLEKISRGESYGRYLVAIVYGYPEQTIDTSIQVNTGVWEEIDSE
jgi:hypothetical protein